MHRRGHGYGSPPAAHALTALRADGVRWIAVTPFGYQDGASAAHIVGFPGHEGRSEFFQRSDPSLTDDDLRAQIADAHRLGMKVALKPHLWSRDFWNGGEWQGS